MPDYDRPPSRSGRSTSLHRRCSTAYIIYILYEYLRSREMTLHRRDVSIGRCFLYAPQAVSNHRTVRYCTVLYRTERHGTDVFSYLRCQASHSRAPLAVGVVSVRSQ